MQLERLCTLKRDSDIRENLRRLPPKLSQLYAEIYSEIIKCEGRGHLSLVQHTFKWLLCARDPLKSADFLYALSFGSTTSGQDFSKDEVQDSCGSFVAFDTELDVLRFTHLSVREFLEEQEEFLPKASNALAAEICLRVLIGSSSLQGAKQFDIQGCRTFASQAQMMEMSATQKAVYEYAAGWWGPHCSEAGEERFDDPLTKLLTFFLSATLDDEMPEAESPLSTWAETYCDDDWSKSWHKEDYFERLRFLLIFFHNASARTYLVACTYGLCEILNIFLAQVDIPSDLRRAGLLAAMKTGRTDILQMLFNLDDGTESSEEIILEHLKLNESGTKEKEVLALLSDRYGTPQNTEAVLSLAVRKRRKEVVSFLLDQDKDFQVSEDVIKSAMYESDNDLATLLLNRGAGDAVTTSLLQGAIDHGHEDMVRRILNRRPKVLITEDLIHSAVVNDTTEILTMLLDAATGYEITESLLFDLGSYMNKGCIREVVRRCKCDNVTTGVLEWAAWKADTESLQVLIDQGGKVEITEAIMKAATCNREWGEDNLLWLLQRGGFISDAVMMEAVSEGSVEMVQLLCDRGAIMTDNVVEALLESPHDRRRKLELALARGLKINITETTMQGLLHDDDSDGGEAMIKLLDDNDVKFKITTEMLVEAASDAGCNHSTTVATLDQCAEAHLVEKVLMAATKNGHCGAKLVASLQDRFEINVTEDLMIAAAGNEGQGLEIIELLLDRSGAIEIIERFQINVIEDLMIAAAGNDYEGLEIMELLLDRSGAIEITERIIAAVLRERYDGPKIMEMLLYRSKIIRVTREIAEALALYGTREQVKFFFSYDRTMIVSSTMLKLAIRNFGNSLGVTALLLDRGGECLVTDEICEQAAAAREPEILELLIRRCNLGTTTRMKCRRVVELQTAVYDRQSDLVQKLIIEGTTMDLPGKSMETPLSVAAERGDEVSVHMLLSAGADAESKGVKKRTPLHRAAESGRYAAARVLLENGANVLAQDEDGDTPLFLAEAGASFLWHPDEKRRECENVIKLLRDYMEGGKFAPR